MENKKDTLQGKLKPYNINTVNPEFAAEFLEPAKKERSVNPPAYEGRGNKYEGKKAE